MTPSANWWPQLALATLFAWVGAAQRTKLLLNEQNFTLPQSMTVERYLYVFVFISYSVLLTLFLLMIL